MRLLDMFPDLDSSMRDVYGPPRKMTIFDGFWVVSFMEAFVLVGHRLRRITTHSLKLRYIWQAKSLNYIRLLDMFPDLDSSMRGVLCVSSTCSPVSTVLYVESYTPPRHVLRSRQFYARSFMSRFDNGIRPGRIECGFYGMYRYFKTKTVCWCPFILV